MLCRSCRNAPIDVGPNSYNCHHGMCGGCCPRTHCHLHRSSAGPAVSQAPPRHPSPRPTSRNGGRVTPQEAVKLCSKCGQPSHKSTSCKAAQKKAQKSCDFCGKTGHMVENCWQARKKHNTAPGMPCAGCGRDAARDCIVGMCKSCCNVR